MNEEDRNEGQEEIGILPDLPGLDYEIESNDENRSVVSLELQMVDAIHLSKREILKTGAMLYVSETDSEVSDNNENVSVVLPSRDHPDNQPFILQPGTSLSKSEDDGDFSATEGSDYICDSEEEYRFTLKTKKCINNTNLNTKVTFQALVHTENDTAVNSRARVIVPETPDTSFEEEINKPPISTNQRSWNRRNCCFYCENLVTNFTRHLQRNHPDEIEVIKLMAITDADPKVQKKKRQAITDDLRNRGNYIHNSNVVSRNEGYLIPTRRKNDEELTKSPSSFVVCKKCLGTYRRSTFYRHSKKCNPENDLMVKRTLNRHALSIIPSFNHASKEFLENILPRLRNDEISLIIKQDPLIIAYGCRLLKKKKERRSRKAICSKMRDLAHLLKIVREKHPDIAQLQDLIDPKYYERFIEAVKIMSGFNEETGNVKTISIPARIRPEILGCIEILFTNTIMDGNKSTSLKDYIKNKLSEFKLLLEANWQWEISSNAEKTRKRNLMTKSQVMPLDQDIENVMRTIHYLEEKYYKNLKKDITNVNYENLCEVTISHIILLDRKRSGDVAEAELQYYLDRKTDDIPPQVLETLDEKQKQAITDLEIFQIPGKRGRSVPILLTKIMKRNIDVLIACRSTLNISSENKYLFARPLTKEPFDGGRCLNRIKSMCNLKKPEMLTSTGLRHHIATISQVHAKTDDKYTQHLATFLGHDMHVHASNYRLPLQAIQKGLVGSRLLEIENHSKNQQTSTRQSENDIRDLYYKNKENDKNGHNEDSKEHEGNNLSTCELENEFDIEINEIREYDSDKRGLDNETKSEKSDGQNESSNCVEKNKKNKESSDYDENDTNKITIDKTKTVMVSKPKRIKRKVQKLQSSDSESSFDMPKKRKGKKSQIKKIITDDESDKEQQKQKRRKKTHTKWTSAEVNAVMRHLKKFILLKKNPGKAVCEDVLRKEPILHKRTWMHINTYINNIYKKNI